VVLFFTGTAKEGRSTRRTGDFFFFEKRGVKVRLEILAPHAELRTLFILAGLLGGKLWVIFPPVLFLNFDCSAFR
jgi:hypothetical protein